MSIEPTTTATIEKNKRYNVSLPPSIHAAGATLARDLGLPSFSSLLSSLILSAKERRRSELETSGGKDGAVLLNDIRDRIVQVQERLADALTDRITLPKDASEARQAKLTAAARGYHTVKTFAAVIGRNPHWVSDRCRVKIIRTLRAGKPYRIPLSEGRRFLRNRI